MQRAFDEVKSIIFGESNSSHPTINMPTSERKGPGGLFDGINGRLKLSPKIEPKFKAQLQAKVDLGTTQRLSFGTLKDPQSVIKSARKPESTTQNMNKDHNVTFSKLMELSEQNVSTNLATELSNNTQSLRNTTKQMSIKSPVS